PVRFVEACAAGIGTAASVEWPPGDGHSIARQTLSLDQPLAPALRHPELAPVLLSDSSRDCTGLLDAGVEHREAIARFVSGGGALRPRRPGRASEIAPERRDRRTEQKLRPHGGAYRNSGNRRTPL